MLSVSIWLIDFFFYIKKVKTLYAATIAQSVVLAYRLKSQMISMKVSVNKKKNVKDINAFTVKTFLPGISAVSNKRVSASAADLTLLQTLKASVQISLSKHIQLYLSLD